MFRHLNVTKVLRGLSFLAFWLSNVHFATAACNFATSKQSKSGPNMRCFVHFDFQMCTFATEACNFSTSEQTKVVPDRQFFSIFTSECAFRHSGVQFFDIWTSKSGPNMRCFVRFDFQMCISPQRRAIFRHLNRQKWSRIVSFLAFSLPNVLFATVACNFSTSERPKVVQTCGVLYILTCKCAFRHSGVQFFDIWTDKSGPNGCGSVL